MEIKRGSLYQNIKSSIRSFDLILFKGSELVSNIISALEKRGNKIPTSGDFSHVGICLKYDILKYIYPNHININSSSVYVWESVVSGVLGNNCYDINGKSFLGVQLRNFDDLIEKYDKSSKTAIAIGTLINNPIEKENIDTLSARFSKIFNKYNGQLYDYNCLSLFSSLCLCCRPCRNPIEQYLGTSDWLFCSELAACVYKDLGVYPDYVNPKDVVPRDLVYNEADTDKMPKIINRITYVTTMQHYKENISNIEYKVNDHKFIKKNKNTEINEINETSDVIDDIPITTRIKHNKRKKHKKHNKY